MNKWSIPIILLALTILGLSIWVTNVQQHTNKPNAKPTHEERVEVVREEGILANKGQEPNLWTEPPTMDNNMVTTYIQEVFQEDSDWALRLCLCESNCNTNALSSTGKYIGLYQYCHTTFDSNCEGSIYEWKDQVNCTYKLFERGEVNRWPNCPKATTY